MSRRITPGTRNPRQSRIPKRRTPPPRTSAHKTKVSGRLPPRSPYTQTPATRARPRRNRSTPGSRQPTPRRASLSCRFSRSRGPIRGAIKIGAVTLHRRLRNFKPCPKERCPPKWANATPTRTAPSPAARHLTASDHSSNGMKRRRSNDRRQDHRMAPTAGAVTSP